MQAARKTLETSAWEILEQIPDPEIPVLSIVDLGIVRSVEVDGAKVTVGVAPTYSGCPATEFIEDSVVKSLQSGGITLVSIRRVLSPPWTSDWISDRGREKLRKYGIAPPEKGAAARGRLLGDPMATERIVACPRCGAENTEKVSEFGSTACKASYKCIECLEPFEYFKCI
ncbi:MAG: 1,2-phenylacetyl-CoA epoxidase subunit PaaD [Gammaproteobacteria bacterium]